MLGSFQNGGAFAGKSAVGDVVRNTVAAVGDVVVRTSSGQAILQATTLSPSAVGRRRREVTKGSLSENLLHLN